MSKIEVNGLILPLNDAHVHQRRGVTAARTESGEPLHITVLRCLDGRHTKTYCGLARADNSEDFVKIDPPNPPKKAHLIDNQADTAFLDR